MKEITYHFSLNYNINPSDTNVVETRAIQREYVDGTSGKLQILKADLQEYSITEMDERMVEKLEAKQFLVLSDEISSEQFESFMDVSCDLLLVDMSKLNLH